MKKLLLLAAFIVSVITGYCQTLNYYTFSAFSSAYTPVSSAFITPSGDTLGSIGGTYDDGWYSGIPIGFNFVYGCTTFTSLLASQNGWVVLGETMPPSASDFPDTWDDDLSNTFSGGFGGFDLPRPILAPLWADIITSGPIVRYATTGVAPNRVFTIEWDSASFYNGGGPPYHGPAAISVELKLYETSNIIDFAYNFITLSEPFTGYLAIGITGGAGAYPQFGAQPYWSLNNTGASPTPSMSTEYKTLTGLPASNQVYRWNPACTGTPPSCTVNATVANGCSPYSSVLSLVGLPCGVLGFTYQWQTSADSASWSNISGATADTYATAVTVTTYYRCIVTCSGSGATFTTAGIGLHLGAPAGGITGPTIVCLGTSVTLTDATPGGTWSSSASGVATVGSSSGVVTGVGVGSATITYTLGSVICFTTAPMTVVSSPSPITPTSPKVCTGATLLLSETLPGGVWSSASTGIATIGSTGVVGGISPGTTLITYSLGSCSATTIVTVNLSPAAIGGPSAVCVGSTITLTDGTTGGTWSSASGGGIATVGVSTGIVGGVANGPVTIKYTAPGGCTVTKAITVNPVPSPIFSPSGICAGTTTSLFDIGGGTWSSSNTAAATVGSSSGIVGGISAGSSFTITYTLPTGCLTTAGMIVYGLPAGVTGTTNICVGVTTTLSDVTGGGTWASTNPAVASVVDVFAGTVEGISPGTDTISYILFPTGCTANITVTVTPPPPFISGVSWACADGTTTLTDLPGGTWSTSDATVVTVGATTGVVTGAAVTSTSTATITYTSPSGCTTSETITAYPLPPAITGTMHMCVGQTTILSDGEPGGTWSSANTAIATVAAGAASSLGITGGVASGTDTIFYSVTYALGTSCASHAIVTVNTSPAPVSGTLKVCVGDTVMLTDVGGGTWASSSSGNATVGLSTGIVGGVTPGTATITYSTGGTCVATAVVTVSALPALFAITGGGTYCAGGTGVAIGMAGSTAGISYQLYLGGAATGPALTGTGGPLTFGLHTTAGTYTILATNTVTGCSRTMTGSATIAISPLPTICSVSGGGAYCAGGTGVLITLSCSDPGVHYQLYNGAAASGSAVTGTGLGITLGPVTGAGAYIVKATSPAGCSDTMTGSAAVAINPLPTAFAVTGGGSICAGGGDHIILTGSAAGVSYQLFYLGSPIGAALSGTGGSLDFGAHSGAGAYTVVGTVTATGCTGPMSGPATITVNPTPAITGPGAVCVGATVTLTATPTGGTWSSSNSANATIGATSGVVGGITTGTSVIITYTSPAGCTTTATVNVSPSPGAIGGPSSVCVGSAIQETDAIPGGLWTSGSTAVATAGSSSGIVTGVSPGLLTITYSLGSGCTVTRVVTVTPAPGAIGGPTAVCGGATILLTDVTTPGGTWSSGNTAIASVNPTSGLAGGITSGVDTITYTLGGCKATTTITVAPAPGLIGGPAAVCQGSTIILTDGGGGGSWTSSNTSIATVTSGGIVNGVATGPVTITYSLGGSCVATKIITVNPISPITGALGICVGASTTLTDGVGGGTWSSGSTTIATIGLSGVCGGVAPGTATITYTTAAGCTAAVVVTVNTAPVAITAPASVCAGTTTVLTDGVPGGIWTSSNTVVATINTLGGGLTAESPGATVITYSLGGTCTKTATVNVTPLPTVSVTSAHVCSGTTATIATATPAGGTWHSSNTAIATVNPTTGAVSGLIPGVDTVTYTATTGCGRSVSVTINSLPTAINGITTICEGVASPLSDGVAGGTWSSSNTAVASVASATGMVTGGAIPGAAVVTYSLGSGCTVTVTVNVIAPPPAIMGPASVCAGQTAVLSDGTPGGTWSSENTSIATVSTGTGVVTGITSGTVIISYTVGTGCARISTIIVNPLSPITGDSIVCPGQAITLTDTTEDGAWSSSASSIASVVTASATTGTVYGISPVGGIAVITYTLPTGCAATRTVTVNQAPPPITGVTNVCVGSTTTLSDASPSGSWSSNNTAIATVVPISIGSGAVTGAAAGSVVITYTAAGTGCPATVTIVVNAVPDPISGPAGVCVGQTATFTDVSGGTWSCAPAAVATINAAGVVYGVSPGAAVITYTLPGACAATLAINVDSLPAPITGNLSVCVGATTTLSDATPGGSWSSSNSANAPVDPFGVVTGLTAGFYTITYTTASGCAATAPVTVVPLPAAIVPSSPAICQGAAIVLTDFSIGGTWASSTSTVATIDSVTGHVLGTGPGITGITYTMGGTGCIRTTSVFVNPAPDPILGSAAICDNSVVSLADSTSGGTWASSNTAVATVDGFGNVSGFALGTSAVSYTVAGCPAILDVTVNPLPGAVAGPAQVCVGSTILLGDAVPGGSWSSGNTAAATVNTTTGVVTGLSSGTADIAYSLGAGCTTFTTVTVNPVPAAITGPVQVCTGGSIPLFSGPAGGAWSSSNTAIATVASSAGAVTGVSAGTVDITYALSTGCNATTILTVNPAPGAILGSPNICLGSPHLLTDAVPGGTWTSSNTAIATIDSATGMVAGIVTGATTINYIIGACSQPLPVTVQPLPEVFDVTGGGSYCNGGVGVHIYLSGSVTGVNYVLYLGAAAVGTFAGTGTGLDFGLQTVAGSYTVMAISTATTCTNTMSGSALVIITATVTPSVNISASPGDSVCAGTSATFTAVPVYGGGTPTYQWSVNGVNVSTSATYTFIPANGDVVAVALTSTGICPLPAVVTHSVTMTVNPFKQAGISISLSPGDTVCQGGSVTLTPMPAYGGPTPIYTWIRNGTNEGTGSTYSYMPTNGDSLRCILVSDYPCILGGDTVSSVEVIMKVDTIQLPIVSINASPGTNIGNGQYDTLTAVVANGGVFPAYQWYVNGYPVASATTNTYISNSYELTREDSVSCMVTSDAVCPATSHQWVFINASNVGVKALSGQPGEVVVIPNPNNGEFTVRGTLNSAMDQEVSLEITDMLGQVVYRNKVTAQQGRLNEHIVLSKNIANGMYLLSLHADSENKVFHIVVEQ